MLTSVVACLALMPAALVPKPNHFVVGEANLQLPIDTILVAPEEARPEALMLKGWLGGRMPWMTRANASGVRMSLDRSVLRDLGPEGYRLNVDQVGARIEAGTTTGLYYGAQSLRQLARTNEDTILIPQVKIEDSPRFKWRGMMLDCSRHFFTVDFIKRLLDQMGALKLNTFHWHLANDQGWRLEIRKYARLTGFSSLRAGTKGRSETSDNQSYGGFYTQAEARDVVAYAAERHINVIPEIEMPGHCTAALAAYPEFSCTGGPFEVGQKWGVYPDIFCAGQDKTFEFLKDILEEVMDIFPSAYIHVGGDEAPKTRWQNCPRCKARMTLEGLKDTNQLQSYFMKRMDAFLFNRGRKLIGWDEILDGGLAEHATVMSWRGRQGGIDAAKQGHDVVMSPSEYCYLDHYQADPKSEPQAVGGYLPLSQVYALDPVPSVLKLDEAKHIMGVQGNLWTEFIDSDARVEYMLFPRLIAIAEVGWTSQANRDFSDFLLRLPGPLRVLDAEGVQNRQIDAGTAAQRIKPANPIVKPAPKKGKRTK